MQRIRRILFVSLLFIYPLLTLAQTTQEALQAIQGMPPLPAASAPDNGLFFTFQMGDEWPPLPGDIMNLPFWDLGNGVYLLDDRNVDYDALEAAAAASISNDMLSSPGPMMTGSMNLTAWNGGVYLTNMAAAFQTNQTTTASFSIAGGTNYVPYDILTSTNAANAVSTWSWLGIGYTSNSYTFSNQPPDQSYYILAQPQKTMTLGWGIDAVGQCEPPLALSNAVTVAGGGGQSLALRGDGTVVAWGQNGYGEGSVPTNVYGVTMISAGWFHDVALLTNGTVTAWGLDFHGLYNLTEVPAYLTNATVISAQALHSLALTSNGTVVAWGYGPNGEATVPSGLSNVVAISAGYEFNLVALANGTVTAWGDNSYGQTHIPSGLSNVVDVAAGPFHSLALKSDGTVVSWGDDSDGETNVPPELTNVVAIAASGDPYTDSAYSLALKSDGTVVMWGEGPPMTQILGMSNVIAIAAGADHALAVRTGPRTLVFTLLPVDQYLLPGSNATFTARAAGLYGVSYQWQGNGVNLPGATNAVLVVTNATMNGIYTVMASNEVGTITSTAANLILVTAPAIISQTILPELVVVSQAALTLSVYANAPGDTNGFPLSYQWQFDGTNISEATDSNYTFAAIASGTFSVIITNAAGTANTSWTIDVRQPGSVVAWGSNTNGESNSQMALTSVIGLAAGTAHGVMLLEDGTVTNWGSYWTGTNFVPVTSSPSPVTAISVAAGSGHDLAVLTNGNVAAWGINDSGQLAIPSNASNVVAVSAGGAQSLALRNDGTVLQWGKTNAPLPGGLSNVMAIASGTNFHLALLSNLTLIAWGANDYGQTNTPSGLTNVVAITAGGSHALALRMDGTLAAWGSITNVPPGLSNVMSMSAGENNSAAVQNDGSLVVWGDNSFGQTNGIVGLNKTKLIASGSDFTAAVQFSPYTQYAVDVTRDVLLVYNTNSTNSTNLKNYYLAHRPMIGGANVLGVGCDVGELTTSNNCDAQIVSPILNWLTNNPTKHPGYLVFFFDVPTRILNYNNAYPSVTLRVYNSYPGISPFITYINANTEADCESYVDKIASFGTAYSPGSLVISANNGGYGNTNFVLDNIRNGGPDLPPLYPYENYSAFGYVISAATSGLIIVGVPTNSILYFEGLVLSNNLATAPPHASGVTNVTAYMSWGVHGAMGTDYALSGLVQWAGNSGWWIIETIESFNGRRASGQGDFTQWFSANAFGGTNYTNTPIGAVTHVEEPGLAFINDPSTYFGLWSAGKTFAICAWNSRRTPYFQAVGDPLIKH